MGFKAECRKALVTGDKVTVTHGIQEYTGKVISYDNNNANDYSLLLELEKGERVIIPVAYSSGTSIKYKPNKKVLAEEKEEEEMSQMEKAGHVPK